MPTLRKVSKVAVSLIGLATAFGVGRFLLAEASATSAQLKALRDELRDVRADQESAEERQRWATLAALPAVAPAAAPTPGADSTEAAGHETASELASLPPQEIDRRRAAHHESRQQLITKTFADQAPDPAWSQKA